MSLVDQHPHPGPEPEKPTSYEGPSNAAFMHNRWIEKLRRHLVAKAVEELRALKTCTPEQTITMVLGIAYLEDKLSSHSPFAGIF